MLTKYSKAGIQSHVLKEACIRCGQQAKEFTNTTCIKTYLNTGLCQRCQDQLPKGELNGRVNHRKVKAAWENN